MLLDNLGGLIFSLLVFVGFLKSLSLTFLMDLHVGIEDLPLSGFSREDSADWWVSLDTFLLDDVVQRLGCSSLEVELVPDGFHLSF